MDLYRTGVPKLSLSMYSFSISIDEHVPLKIRIFSKEGAIVDFPGVGQQYFCKGAKSGTITFSPLETKETTFLQTCLPFFFNITKIYLAMSI